MTDVRRPRALAPGDTVALVAPASPFGRDEFDAGVDELRALGFVPVWDDDVFARARYLAGDASVRAASFMRAWTAPATAGLFAIRGGYGSVTLPERLDPGTIRGAPRAFVGYSDLTVLLNWLVCRCGVVAFHGPTVAGRLGRGTDGYDRASLLAALTVTAPMGELEAPTMETLVRGEARGRLLGGTLTQIAAVAGTPEALEPWDDTILLLEDVGERPYRVDRLIQQVRRSGLLRRVRGVVLGTFPRCDEPGGSLTARDVLADLFAGFPGPVVYGLPAGHVDGPALTVPLGVEAVLETTRTPRLIVDEAAVAPRDA